MLVVEPIPTALSTLQTVDRFTSWLTLVPLNFTTVAPIPVCTVAGQIGCVWPGENAIVDGVATPVPPVCTVSVSGWDIDDVTPNRWCANITTTGNVSRIKLYGNELVTPLYATVTSGVELKVAQAFDGAAARVCGLWPYGRYNVWAGPSTAALCHHTVVAPERPITATPEIVPLPLSLGQTSISFFFRVVNQSAPITHIVVRRFDPDGGVVLHRYSGAQIVATVHPGISGIVFRTFTTPFAGGSVDANTEYVMQVAIADSSFTVVTPYSANVTGTTLKSVQPKPTKAEVTVIPDDRDNVHVVIPPFHPAGDTVEVRFRVYSINDKAVKTTLAEYNCSGACPEGLVVRVVRRVQLVTYRVLNDVGLSEPSVPTVITREPAKSVAVLTDGAIVAIVLAVLVLAVTYFFAVRHYTRTKTYVRPIADPELEIDDRTMVQVREVIGGGSTCRVHRAIFNNKIVAAKVLSSEHVGGGLEFKSFFREIAVLSAMNHHNVVRVVGCVTKTDPLIILTELCERGSLSDMLSSTAHVRHRAYMTQMIASVRYIHDREVLHRDLAARNWFVHADGTLRLGDFGMAHNLAYGASEYSVKSGRVASRWASPATLVHNVFNYGTDVWSLTVALHELYSQGVKPFAYITSAIEVEEHIVGGGRLNPPTRMPADVAVVCRTLWARNDRLLDVTVNSIFPDIAIESML